jgi:hypothetical protein
MQSTEPSRPRKSKAKAISPEGAAFQTSSIIQQNFAVSLEPQVSESQFKPSWVTLKHKRYQIIHHYILLLTLGLINVVSLMLSLF